MPNRNLTNAQERRASRHSAEAVERHKAALRAKREAERAKHNFIVNGLRSFFAIPDGEPIHAPSRQLVYDQAEYDDMFQQTDEEILVAIRKVDPRKIKNLNKAMEKLKLNLKRSSRDAEAFLAYTRAMNGALEGEDGTSPPWSPNRAVEESRVDNFDPNDLHPDGPSSRPASRSASRSNSRPGIRSNFNPNSFNPDERYGDPSERPGPANPLMCNPWLAHEHTSRHSQPAPAPLRHSKSSKSIKSTKSVKSIRSNKSTKSGKGKLPVADDFTIMPLSMVINQSLRDINHFQEAHKAKRIVDAEGMLVDFEQSKVDIERFQEFYSRFLEVGGEGQTPVAEPHVICQVQSRKHFEKKTREDKVGVPDTVPKIRAPDCGL